MQPEDFQKTFNVSRETMEKLQTYHKLLFKWQGAINLVGPRTLQDSWARHFADSAQLLPHIPEGVKTLADLGSGAGFPGLVLAMMRPDLDVHLVESDERKAQFLRTVSRETNTPVQVHNARIEDVTADIAPDMITARALASLVELFVYCLPWTVQNNDIKLLFLKGKLAQEEVGQARAAYDFDVQTYPSCTDDAAEILFINRLNRR